MSLFRKAVVSGPDEDFVSDYYATIHGFPEPILRFEERSGRIYAFTAREVWRRVDHRRGWERLTGEDRTQSASDVIRGSTWERWRKSISRAESPDWAEPLDG